MGWITVSFDKKNSPTFKKYLAALWSGEPLLIARIIEEGLASSDPVERANYLALKAVQYAEHREVPGHLDRAWDTLDEALRTAPDPGLHAFRAWLLQLALAVYFQEGPVHRGPELFRKLRPGLWQLVREPDVSYNLACCNLSAGRFRQARLWLNQAYRAHYLDTQAGLNLVNVLSVSAWLNLLLCRTRAGEAELQEARRLFELHGEGRPRLYSLAMAEAWAALASGRLQAARSSLQKHLVLSPDSNQPLAVFQAHVLAARLALAEGSSAGYRHFCDQARAVCDEHQMPLSREFLRVVMADTERQYGAK